MKNWNQFKIFLFGCFVFSALVFSEWNEVQGYHNFFFRSANDITSGILNNARLDNSSVTKQGNTFNGANQLIQADGNGLVNNSDLDTSSITKRGQLRDGLEVLTLSSATFYGTATSSTGFIGVGSSLTLINADNLSLGTVPNARLDDSSVTQRGQLSDGLQTLTLSSVTSYGTFSSSTGFVGVGSTLTSINASNLSFGTIPNARLDSSSVTKLGAKIDLADSAEVIGNLPVTNLNNGVDANINTFWRGNGSWGSPGSPGSGGSTVSIYYNLIVTTNGTNTNQWVITADKVIIQGDVYTNVATSCFMNVNGIGGIDTGSELASTWYKLHLISNGSTVSVVASSFSNLSPTFPSGYTKNLVLGGVRNNASSNLVTAIKRDKQWAPRTNTLLVDVADLSGVNITDLSNEIPPDSTSVKLKIELVGSGNGCASAWFEMEGLVYTRTGGGDQFSFEYCSGDAAQTNNPDSTGMFDLPIFDSMRFRYEEASVVGPFKASVYGATEAY